ncbi:MAG: hypothetical protein AAGG44_01025 [Planctomycetota bacterium]
MDPTIAIRAITKSAADRALVVVEHSDQSPGNIDANTKLGQYAPSGLASSDTLGGRNASRGSQGLHKVARVAPFTIVSVYRGGVGKRRNLAATNRPLKKNAQRSLG